MKYIIKTKKSNAYPTLESARKAAELLCKSTGKIVEVYSHIATCHPPEPQPCRWEEVAKKSDRDFDRVPLGDLPAPPEGFAFYGIGPLISQAKSSERGDVMMLVCPIYRAQLRWNIFYNGDSHERYAIRIGSDIARKNGIGGGE